MPHFRCCMLHRQATGSACLEQLYGAACSTTELRTGRLRVVQYSAHRAVAGIEDIKRKLKLQ